MSFENLSLDFEHIRQFSNFPEKKSRSYNPYMNLTPSISRKKCYGMFLNVFLVRNVCESVFVLN